MIDNAIPKDPRYPRFRPAATAYNPREGKDGHYINCIVEVGDYLIDRDGMIMIATTSNAGCTTDFDRMVNEPCIRARYIGNTDDMIVCANQIREATGREIAKAVEYQPKPYQLNLLAGSLV